MKKADAVIVVLVIALAFSLYYIFRIRQQDYSSCPSKYKFISSDLNCDEDPADTTLALRQSVKYVVSNLLTLKKADRISVFYRDLDNKQWFGINENDQYDPSSLLKLPIAIAYYKLAEIDPSVLNRQYTYTSKDGPNLALSQTTKPKEELVINTKYSIDELINRMIQYSDNSTVPILSGLLDQTFLNKVLVDLGVNIPVPNNTEQNFLSAKTYGGILRSLFTASYLNQYYSNHLLQIMGQSDFKIGLIAGVPANIKVANKFGEYVIFDQNTKAVINVELHDCGIIYAPNSPYILCVMTQGEDYNELSSAISLISKNVYENR